MQGIVPSIAFHRNARAIVLAIVALLAGAPTALAQGNDLVWAADAEGGAPYVEAAADDPSRVEGFDVDVAQLLAAGLGRRARFVQAGFTTLDAAVARGDFDIALGGLEETPARRSRLAVTVPYYEFREVITVRSADRDRYRTLADLRGRQVATLGATQAYDVLSAAASRDGFTVVAYEDDVHPYADLALGRVDAVVLDHILAERGVRRNPGLVNQAEAVAVGHYVGLLAPGQTALRDACNAMLRAAMRDGRLEAIFRRWNVWTPDQARLYREQTKGVDVSAADPPPPVAPATKGHVETATTFLPALARAAVISLVLSTLAMAMAIVLGSATAVGRVYGGPVLRTALTIYVELIRGTPLLLQLFVLYFGLAPLIRLPAFAAALIGLGLNYGAYESEIYRGALEAVPAGQLEAARTLGFTERQTLTLVRAPQALRLALAPMTNDFVALLKDSSLVSVITVVELTKQASIFAANIGSWLVPGLLCAGLYLVMSLPLARLSRRLEQRWGTRA
jgi:polar amino acid transport system substrate-binding protein